jgi:enoyl-[acyl-carrier protein] reductase II
MLNTRISNLFRIQYPIIQAGMVWVSGYKLALAVSQEGGLGLIGAGSMKPDNLENHIKKVQERTQKPFGVNIPLMRGDVEELINVILKNKVEIVFTSAGSPQKYTQRFKDSGLKVVHVISSVKQALKSQESGVDAVVAEGFEAGGHNGVDEITTLCLVPQVVDALSIPVIAAGGIADGRAIAAAFMLGAEGVQIGTRFAASIESSAHDNYKNAVVNAKDSGTQFILRKLSPIRTIRNRISEQIKLAELSGASIEGLKELLNHKREFRGIFEGDLEEGLLEAGQSSGLVSQILSVKEIFKELIDGYNSVVSNKINNSSNIF